MAELRSFIIGVTIAGALLLFAGLALGLFGDDSSGSPSVRLLGTPPATRTPAPPATRDPSELTPIATTDTPAVPTGETPGAGTPPAGETPGGQTPGGIATATPTLETAPTAAVTSTPEPQNDLVVYVDTANSYTPGLVAQIEYLIGNANAPNVNSAEWRTFTLESAQSVQALAGAVAGIPAPACVASAHAGLAAAANQASSAAGSVIAGVNANDAGAVQASAGALGSARSAIDSAVGSVSAAVGAC